MNGELSLLAIDVGLTIGYAWVTVEQSTMRLIDLKVAEERTPEAKPYGTFPMNLLVAGVIDRVVVEDFVGAGHRTAESNYVLKQIGGFEAVCAHKSVPFKLHTPAMRKPFLKDGAAFYKSLSGHPPCHHGRDALAHALRYFKDEMDWDFRRWLCDF